MNRLIDRAKEREREREREKGREKERGRAGRKRGGIESKSKVLSR